MQQAQANKLDHWAFYQARNAGEAAASGRRRPPPRTLTAPIAHYEQLVAEQDQKDYDAANFRDDQFDLSDAFLALSVALLAVTSLTRQRWLYGLAMVPTAFGVLMGLAGLCGWPIHPGWLSSLFS
jgi:hypothetical protein